MSVINHPFEFDPAYGYDLNSLLQVAPPPEPAGFLDFWRERYQRAIRVATQPKLTPSHHQRTDFKVWDIEYTSVDNFTIRGWLLVPSNSAPQRGFIVGHGYGGIEAPNFALPCSNAVYLLPSFRGLALSRDDAISTDPNWHVLHDIQSREKYILGGCVADVWTGVSALLEFFPEVANNLGYLGISFSGGVGAIALALEPRIHRAHVNVPSFGHHPVRLKLPTIGSAAAVQNFAKQHSHVAETLRFYDAAIAARYIRQPMHIAAALFDPVVAPPGQFAIYNALPLEKHLFVLNTGHFDTAQSVEQERALLLELRTFFDCDESRIPPMV